MDDTENLELSDLEAEAAPPPPSEGGEDASPLEGDIEGGQQMMAMADDEEMTAAGLNAVYDIPVQIAAVLGTSSMQVSQLLKLGRGAVVELDRKVGEAIDIYVNNRLVARGEVVVVNERLGVTMTEIIKAD